MSRAPASGDDAHATSHHSEASTGERQLRLCLAHGGDMGEPSGGTDRVAALAGGLAERGHEVTLVIPTPAGPVPGRLDPVECVYVDTPASSVARAALIARRAHREAQVRDAILQLEHSTLAGIGALVGVDDYVLDMHDLGHSRFDHVETLVAPLLKRTVARLEHEAVRRAAHIVVVSAVMAEQLQRLWNVPSEKISVVPNGYVPDTVSQFRDVPTVPGRVAFLGTLHPKVDVATLVAIAELPATTDLVVIGDGARRGHLERAAAQTPALRTTGRLPDAEAFELVASANAVVNPQTVSAIQRSSSPVKLYYYAALGKPMVVTPGPSVVDALVQQQAAITACSRRHFINRVAAVLDDSALAARLAENAVQAAKSFTWADRVHTIEAIHRTRVDAY